MTKRSNLPEYTTEDLLAYYDGPHTEKYGEDAPIHLNELFEETKKEHWNVFRHHLTKKDHEQAWKGFLGNNSEKLIAHIIKDEVNAMGLAIAQAKGWEKKSAKNLTAEEAELRQNLAIDYGELGQKLPDADIVLYEPATLRIVAVISSKTSLRERIAQTAYWRIKLTLQDSTERIKMYLFTPDKDGAFAKRKIKTKSRVLAEAELDCTYVMSPEPFEVSDKIKPFADFFDDLRRLVGR